MERSSQVSLKRCWRTKESFYNSVKSEVFIVDKNRGVQDHGFFCA